MDEDPPYMGCLNLPGPVPSTLCSNPPPAHRMPAIFSTRLGTLPVRYLPLGVRTPIVIRSDPQGDILFVAEKYAAEHPEAVNKMDFMPTSYQSLYQYFDPYDLFVQGPESLFEVVHRLAWHTLAKKRRFDRLVTTWCADNIPKLAQLPFVGSPVKMLLDAEDWYYFGFSHISEHDMNLICYKLDRAAYDIKPQVDQYKEFRAAPTPAPITPVSPIKQGSGDAQDAAMVSGPSLAAIANGDAQEPNGPSEPSEIHAALRTALSSRIVQVALENIPSGPPGGSTQTASPQEIQDQSQVVSAPVSAEVTRANVGLNAPTAMGLDQSRATLQRGSSGYSIDTTLAELREDESERIPRVALPGQVNRPKLMPSFKRHFNVNEMYNGHVNYHIAASQDRLISIRLTDTYDAASILKLDLIPEVFITCGDIESYRPYPAHAEMTFYFPECAQKAAEKTNNQRILGTGHTLMVFLVQSFDNSPLPGSTIDHNNQDNVVGCRNFSLQDGRVNTVPSGRTRVNTGSSWATAPEFTPRATPAQTPVSIPLFRPTPDGSGLYYEQSSETMTGQFRETLPVVRHRSSQELMPNMQFGLGRVPSMPLHGTPMGQFATLPRGYPSTPLVSTPAGPPAGPPSANPASRDYAHGGSPFRPQRGTRRPNQPPYENRPNGYQAAPRAGFGRGGLPRTTNTPARNHSTPYMEFRNSGPSPETNTPAQRQTSWQHQQDRPRAVSEAEQRAIPVNNCPVGVLYNPVSDCPLPVNGQGYWIRAASITGPVLQSASQSQLRRESEPSPHLAPRDAVTTGHTDASNAQTTAAVATFQPHQNEPQGILATIQSSQADRLSETEAELLIDEVTPPSGFASNNDAEGLRRILECVTAPVAEEAAAAAMGRAVSHVSEDEAQAIRGLLESVTAPLAEVVAAPTTELPKSRSITTLEEIEGAPATTTLCEEQNQISSDDAETRSEDKKSSDAAKTKICPVFETWKAKAVKSSFGSGDEKENATRTRTGSDSSARGNRASGARGGRKNRKMGRGRRLERGEGSILSPTNWPSLSGGPSMQPGGNAVSPRPSVMRTTSGRRDSMAAVAGKANSAVESDRLSSFSSQSQGNSGATRRGPHTAAGRRAERRERNERSVEWNGKRLSMASEWEVETRGGGSRGGKRAEWPLRREVIEMENWRGKGKEEGPERGAEW